MGRAAGLATVKAASRVSRIPLNSRRRPRVRPRVSLCFLMPSARMSNYKSKLHTEQDSLQFTQRSKKRLDYQMETANVHKRVEQKHMVDWIVAGVHASITPEEETAALNKCVADLKALASA